MAKNRYNRIYKPNSIHSHKGFVHLHISVMEKYIGRSIPYGCEVHHKNRNVDDNTMENLVLLPSKEIHMEIHDFINNGDFASVKKYEAYGLNFMNNLKSGYEMRDSIPGAFLRKKNKVKKSA